VVRSVDANFADKVLPSKLCVLLRLNRSTLEGLFGAFLGIIVGAESSWWDGFDCSSSPERTPRIGRVRPNPKAETEMRGVDTGT
jgi:hypothetical protein